MASNGDLQPTTLVIFGITGDLSQRKLLPALYHLHKLKALPAQFQIIGISRRHLSTNEVFTKVLAYLPGDYDHTILDHLTASMELLQLDPEQPQDYQQLAKLLVGDSQVVFYLAVPPDTVTPIITNLGAMKLNGPNVKLLLEKPFGTDLASAEALIKLTNQYFQEDQLYRIDHYLAKEMSQNIIVFRQKNSLFRMNWNANSIKKIEIIATEQEGIEGRSEFYERTGALRDVVQSHLLQLLALTLMDLPNGSAKTLPELRLAALQQIIPVNPSSAKRAQYQTYRAEVNNLNSAVETWAELQLQSSDPNWRSTAITLITGKALATKLTAIKVYFCHQDRNEANLLCLQIQPNEGVEIDVWAKRPGLGNEIEPVKLNFSYQDTGQIPEAYERVLVDAFRGDHSLFTSSDEVLASWRIIEPVLQAWTNSSTELSIYPNGSSVGDSVGD